MNAIGFLDAVYRAKHDQAGLLNDLGGILASESAAVRLIPFGCEAESVEWFGQRLGFSHRRNAPSFACHES